MREIKFRAWDTKRQKMWSPEEMGEDQLTLMPNGKGFVNVHGTSTKLSTFLPYFIPEQYTGLKDKNGVEIYEGDIINNAKGFSYVVKWGPDLKTNNPNYTGWVMRAPDIKGSDFGANELFEWSKGDIEIIGTIHDKTRSKTE